LATSHLAVLEVEGDVGVPLEDAHLAFAFEADAAGGDVGNTAVGKEDAGVGDILLAGEDRRADGVDALHRRTDDVLYDVDIVDHQVKHHVDVVPRGLKGAIRTDSMKSGS